jgi:hypothetical protein
MASSFHLDAEVAGDAEHSVHAVEDRATGQRWCVDK